MHPVPCLRCTAPAAIYQEMHVKIVVPVALRFAAGLLAAACLPAPAHAQSESPEAYPSKPVRLIIPFAPAGSTDLLGRVAADVLATELRQPFIAVNVAGAGGTVGALQVCAPGPMATR